MTWEEELWDYALGDGAITPDSPASDAQLQYLEYLVLDGRVNMPKQLEQHYYFVRNGLTFGEASSLIQLIKAFELEPVVMSQKEIAAQVEKRANRDL
jgi:hypothetical protein